MNSDHETKTGGASITPSARRSIHDHRGACIFSQVEKVNMVRYGADLEDQEVDVSPQHAASDQGRDEVDNVMSKFARAPSPIPARHVTQKRKSLDDGITFTDDSDLSSKLAKSLPLHLESLLSHSSDEFGNQLSTNSLNRSGESPQSRRNKRNWRENDSSFPSNYESIPGTPRPYNVSHNRSARIERKSNVAIKFLMGVLTCTAAIVLGVYNGNLPNSLPVFTGSDTYNTGKFYHDLNTLGGKYKITDDTVLQLQTGISTIFKREDTGSFVLAYKSNNKNFNQDKFDNLVNNIAAAASKYLRNDSTSVQHIVVDGSKLEMRSHSELISKYRDDVLKTGVLLVRELDEVPSALAMAFHYYCDEYNPLVKKSAIFFTLDMAKCSHNPAEQQATHAHIEKCLKQKWSGVPKDNISPLLNRVVSTVVNISGE